MYINPDTTSIVILGAWNPGILQPQWLTRNIFHKPAGQETPVTIAFPVSPHLSEPPRFTIENITFTPSLDRLSITPSGVSADELSSAEEKASTILNSLPHTPVSAFGENFEFIEAHPTKEILQVFDLRDDLSDHLEIKFSNISTNVVSSLKLEDCVLNLTRAFFNGKVHVKFNFHYEVSSAADAVQKLNGSFSRNYDLAIKYLTSYNLIIDNSQEGKTDEQERINA